MILLVDNYDSFTHNLWQLLRGRAGPDHEVRVLRNDAADAAEVLALDPSHVVLSPGPGRPEGSGLSLALPDLLPSTPLLGVCLGHQALAVAAGGRVTHANQPLHGHAVPILHDGAGLFRGLASPLHVALYHSLAVHAESLPACLSVQARSTDGTIMALRHEDRPHHGVQFHPESFMTAAGSTLVDTFLATATREFA